MIDLGWELLGASYLDLNAVDKALHAFLHALSIRPNRHSIHIALSECYRRLGDVQRASDHVEKAKWLQLNRKE